MAESGVMYLLWNDLVGVTRTRGVPLSEFDRRLDAGLGWAMAGQALTAFEDIVENVWGPMDEARQIPDPDARFTIPGNDDHPAVHAVICDSKRSLDEDWPACARTFFRNALADLKSETGLDLVTAFEHEFSVEGEGFQPRTPFSFAAAREQHGLLCDLEAALQAVGVAPETIEPEFGVAQYEVSCGPQPGLHGADSAVIVRETIREVARRRGLEASLTPKPAPDAVGNGCHIHLSFADTDGTNVTHDPDGPMGLGPVAARFAAGILSHAEALVAITAPTPVSYYRLGPHHWSCGFRAIGVQNREATVRVVPGIARGADAARRRFNIEYRPVDATASPYLALGALVHAGLDGIRNDLALPKPAEKDPADMADAELAEHDIVPLPDTLGGALDKLESDVTLKACFPDDILSTFLALKRWECRFAAENDEAHVFARYRSAY